MFSSSFSDVSVILFADE